jgi:N-acetylneuraminic acid mutarotase
MIIYTFSVVLMVFRARMTSSNWTSVPTLRHSIETLDWQQVHTSDIPPSPRDRHSAVRHDKSIFVFGGYDGQAKLSDFYEYNTETNTWQEVICSGHGVTPSARHSHSCVVYEDSMYLFGGFDGYFKNDLHRFNFITNTWLTISTLPTSTPKPRYLASAAVYKDMLFLFGGHDESRSLNDFYVFNFSTEQWTTIDFHSGVIPPPRDSHTIITHANSLYLFGGSATILSNLLYEYKVEESRWCVINSKAGATPPSRYQDRGLIDV